MAKRKIGASMSSPGVRRLAEMVRQEVEARLGEDATFEQRRAAAVAFMVEAVANVMDNGGNEDQGGGSLLPVGDGPCAARHRSHR